MATIKTYLTFNGNCREAMTFYKECLGGELTLETVKGSPMESHCPREMHNNILHASLENNGLSLLSSDMAEPGGVNAGNNVSLSLICANEAEIETLFKSLAEGGSIKYPLHDFYSGKIGVLVDKFSINWILKL